MLKDKDRIFTNLYGFESPFLEGAIKRGDWDGTKEIIGRGHDSLINEMKESGLRGLAGPGEVFTSLFGNCHEAAHLHTFLNVESQFNPAQMRLFKAERAKGL